MNTIYIYGLFDPRTCELRYIGQTTNLTRRLRNHIKDARYNERLHRNRWIRQLLKEGLEPAIEILEECRDSNWQEVERAWIKEAKEKGARLTNITIGGEGLGSGKDNPLFGKKLSVKHKGEISDGVRESWIRRKDTGYKVSDEAKLKMSKAHKNPTEEERKRISDRLRGNKNHLGHRHSEETKQKLSNYKNMLGHKHTDETKQKMREASLKSWAKRRSQDNEN